MIHIFILLFSFRLPPINDLFIGLFHYFSLTYEQWDAIADSYIPCLFVLSLVLLAYQHKPSHKASRLCLAATFTLGIMQVYAWMFLDIALTLWPSFDMDYSTHTALALWCCIFIVWRLRQIGIRQVGISQVDRQTLWCQAGIAMTLLSFFTYACLMLYQKYHSLADIISTTIVLCLSSGLVLLGHQYIHRRAKT